MVDLKYGGDNPDETGQEVQVSKIGNSDLPALPVVDLILSSAFHAAASDKNWSLPLIPDCPLSNRRDVLKQLKDIPRIDDAEKLLHFLNSPHHSRSVEFTKWLYSGFHHYLKPIPKNLKFSGFSNDVHQFSLASSTLPEIDVEILFHGTQLRNLLSILKVGFLPTRDQDGENSGVWLAFEPDTAFKYAFVEYMNGNWWDELPEDSPSNIYVQNLKIQQRGHTSSLAYNEFTVVFGCEVASQHLCGNSRKDGTVVIPADSVIPRYIFLVPLKHGSIKKSPERKRVVREMREAFRDWCLGQN